MHRDSRIVTSNRLAAPSNSALKQRPQTVRKPNHDVKAKSMFNRFK